MEDLQQKEVIVMARIGKTSIPFILVWVFLVLIVVSFVLDFIPGVLVSVLMLFFFAVAFAIPNLSEES